MKAGIDVGPEKVWAVLSEAREEVRTYKTLEEALGSFSRREVCLTVPLDRLAIQNHTAERTLSPQEALTLGENLLGTDYVLPLPARRDAQGVYFFIGYSLPGDKPLPGRSFTPRFLAFLLALGVDEGILVYKEGRRKLGVVFQGEYFPMIRDLAQGGEVEEVERLIRYARSSGIHARVLVPEEEAETYAPLAEGDVEVEVYEENGLGALGALRALEAKKYLLQSQRVEKLIRAEVRYGQTGVALGGIGLLLGIVTLGMNLLAELERKNLEEAYTRAVALEAQANNFRTQLEKERERLKNWLELADSDRSGAILSLLRRTTQEAWFAGNQLRGVEVRGGKEGVVLTLQGSRGNAVALLAALEAEGRLVLQGYRKDGSIQVEVVAEGDRTTASSR